MRRKAGLKVALAGLISVLTLSGCATVSVKAAIIDDETASFAIQKVVTHEGYIKYLESLQDAGEEVVEEAPLDLTGHWVEVGVASTSPVSYEVTIDEDSVRIYETTGITTNLSWRGTYLAPTESVTTYTWMASKLDDPDVDTDDLNTVPAFTFEYGGDLLSYIPRDPNLNGTPRPIILQRVAVEEVEEEAGEEEVTPREEIEEEIAPAPAKPTKIQLDAEQLCDSFAKNLANLDPAVAGVEPTIECTDVDFAVTTVYEVEYDIKGVNVVNGQPVDPFTRDKLPFSIYVDQEYGDVVFEHRIIGLLGDQFPTTESWFAAVTDYNVSVYFPGGVNDYNGQNSGAESDGNTVTWNYDTIKMAVDNSVYYLRAAGVAHALVNPLPYLISIGGFIFLLSILLFFTWTRFAARTAANISLFLIPVAPFGLGMAIIAMKKAKRDAAVKRRATISMVINGALTVFIALVVVLTLLLAPQIVADLFAGLGW